MGEWERKIKNEKGSLRMRMEDWEWESEHDIQKSVLRKLSFLQECNARQKECLEWMTNSLY